jgi:hypothetical protein
MLIHQIAKLTWQGGLELVGELTAQLLCDEGTGLVAALADVFALAFVLDD